MANGRAATLQAHDRLAGEPFLAIGEIAGHAASARILMAAALTLDDIEPWLALDRNCGRTESSIAPPHRCGLAAAAGSARSF